MWLSQKGTPEKNEDGNGLVAVGLDRDKGSQHALKWAVDHVLSRGQTVILIHVKIKSSQSVPGTPESRSKVTTFDNVEALRRSQKIDQQTKELFLPFRFFCTRKDVVCRNVVLEDTDVAKALIEYVSDAAIETLVIGASSKHGFLKRFKSTDISSTVSKQAPDFCNVYVINKGKIASMRTASCAAPATIPRAGQMRSQPSSCKSEPPHPHLTHSDSSKSTSTDISAAETPRSTEDMDVIKSPFTRRGCRIPSRNDIPIAESDLSFVSTDTSFYDQIDSDNDFMGSFKSVRSGRRPPDVSHKNEYTSFSQNMDDVEAEMRRLKLELRQTMDMYSRACKEALTAKQKSDELARWKMEEERRVSEARMSEEVALSIAEKEKAKARAALEAAEAQQRIALLEAQKRVSAEMKALKEKQEKMKVFDALAHSDARYRKYTIDDIEQATEFFNHSAKVGEGGYGPVYKGYLDHTAVAIKILRPDASQGRSQFQQEIEVLSNIRHPNMVLLLGACPEYGCLVYEYMANGSLEDCLFRKGDKPVLSWQLRFRIAAEIGTGLLFLHQTKPEPLVHRDLKPGNILLDQNYTSKISDVGLARLVPPSVSNSITQLRMTSTAGTFCYIDPEYQQTGMLGVKSDVYSLGIMLLQLVTAKNAMGLAHHAQKAIENGKFGEMLDPAVPDWPVQEAVGFAKLALRCAELRRKDRPDLATEILPELERLRSLAEDNMPNLAYGVDCGASPSYSRRSVHQDVMSDHMYLQSAESSNSRLSG